VISFFKDANLTIPVSQSAPKRVLIPAASATKIVSLWLGDAYSAKLTAAASIGATTLTLDQTDEFMPSGTALVNGLTVIYTGKTTTTLTGVTGVTSALVSGLVITPNTKWILSGNLSIVPISNDSSMNLLLSGKRSDLTIFNFPGSPILYSQTQLVIGQSVQLDVQVTLNAGERTFDSAKFLASTFYKRDATNNAAPGVDEIGTGPQAYLYIQQHDQGTPSIIRVLSAARQVQPKLPGFLFDQYRWRDENTINAKAIVPGSWQVDIAAIGIDKFLAGIGQGDDLKPLGIQEQDDDSLNLLMDGGFYYTGPNGYYLPADPRLEIFRSVNLQYTLAAKPKPQTPIFVGTWQRDSKGAYETYQKFRYQPAINPSNSELQFTIDRKTSLITLSTAPPDFTMFLGITSGQASDTFNLNIFPVDFIDQVWIDYGVGNLSTNCPTYSFDRDGGTVTVTNPGVGAGLPLYGSCRAAVAVLYDGGETDQIVVPVELNPAFSGLSSGFVYLQQRKLIPGSLVLATDKPQITLPGTNELAYGPVYFDGDYSLLTATVYGINQTETVPDIELTVVPGANFQGLLNYKDPNTGPVTASTGGDGSANLIYIPGSNYGYFLPTASQTHVAADTLTLPVPVPVAQIFLNGTWLIATHAMYNNDPYYGMAGAGAGQIPWLTSGTPGTVNYRTNGLRQNLNLNPAQALDASGQDATVTGQPVVKLIYPQSLPTAYVGSYLVTFQYVVSLQVTAADYGLVSNTVILQMALPPDPVITNPWLIFNDLVNGRLNQYRLGSLPPF
jgi:hypothetical protein